MQKVLLTGFSPFGGEKINPALKVVREFEREVLPRIKISVKELPVVFGKAIVEFKKAVDAIQPQLIISVGQAGGRMDINIERVGININDTIFPDNEGNKPVDEPIESEGPVAYFTTLETKKTILKIREAGIPAKVSNSAGTYVCNNLIYGALHYLASKSEYSTVKYGFVHIPFLPEQAALKNKSVPSMSLPLMKKALEIIIHENLSQ